jgi:hypothetical protein
MKNLLFLFLIVGLHSTSISTKLQPTFSFTSKISTDLQEYTGKYIFTTSGSPITSFTVTEKVGELFGEADSYGANKLIKQPEADKFVSTSSYGSTIIFVRHVETKKVIGLQLLIQGNTLEATKEE